MLVEGNPTNVIIYDSSFAHNTADGGAGLAVENATFTMQFSSITNNQAATAGGGVSLRASPTPTSGGLIQFYDSTIAQNTAPKGAGIYNLTTFLIKNVTLVGNTNDGIFNSGTLEVANIDNSVLQNTLNCATDGLVNAFSGGGNFATDLTCHLNATRDQQGAALVPQLGPLTNQNSLTWYEAPQAGSPLIDAALPPCSTTDQLHQSRSAGCDIGAVEYSQSQGVAPQPTSVSQPGSTPTSSGTNSTATPNPTVSGTQPPSGTPSPAATIPPVGSGPILIFIPVVAR